jgi:hypothetical protein
MSTNHWICVLVGVGIGFFILPAVLQMVQNKG